jgi:hypothetical protein
MSYQPPLVVQSYSVEELRADAAACSIYQVPSDRALKQEIKTVGSSLDRLGKVRG